MCTTVVNVPGQPMFENLNDAIDVLSAFTAQGIEPVRFRWRRKVYRVTRLTGRWQRREGISQLHHFAVQCAGGGSFELCYDPRTTRWVLSRAWIGEEPTASPR